MDVFRILPHLAALAGAYALAFPIGWNREREARSAGLRTFPLVAVASCGFVQATESLVHGSPEATSRIIEGLITGMGFIGGGAILKEGGSVSASGRRARSVPRSASAATTSRLRSRFSRSSPCSSCRL